MSIVLVISGSVVASPTEKMCHWRTTKALMLSLTSTVLSITSLLNFSLSVVLSIVALPLAFTESWQLWPVFCFAVDIGSQCLKLTDAALQWEMFGVWTEPFYYFIVVPLMLQAAVVCSLPVAD